MGDLLCIFDSVGGGFDFEWCQVMSENDPFALVAVFNTGLSLT